MKRIVNLIVAMVLVIVAVSFTLLNSQPVHLKYYFISGDVNLVVVMLICFILGALLGILAIIGKVISLKHELVRRDKKIKITEKEVENLRSLPLKNDH